MMLLTVSLEHQITDRDRLLMQLTILPPVEELQTDPATRAKWIDYSAYDAKATWQLAQALRKALLVSQASTTCFAVCLLQTPSGSIECRLNQRE